jgi:uncharacterized SAM-binding protein YcdF (DUF218 family)
VALLVIFYAASTRAGAALLAFGLVHGLQPLNLRDASGVDAVVVLGGGVDTVSAANVVLGQLTTITALRVLEGVRVYNAGGTPFVIVSGGVPDPRRGLRPESALMAAALAEAGVPPDRVLQDREAKTTHDHPRTVAPLLGAHQVRRFVLVTSPTHMRRALAVFRKAGFDPIPSVSLIRSEHLAPLPWLRPNDESMLLSNSAVYDYLAWVEYWLRGWV